MNNTIEYTEDGYLALPLDGIYMTPEKTQLMREFFQRENDERLGRWRWPENPDYVVYARGTAGVHVLDESSGIGAARYIHRNGDPCNPTAEYQAAYAYFAAHPESKPWLDAKPGEIWDVTTKDGGTKTLRYVALLSAGPGDVNVIYLVPVDNVRSPKLGLNATVITAATRIYPKEES